MSSTIVTSGIYHIALTVSNMRRSQKFRAEMLEPFGVVVLAFHTPTTFRLS